MMVVMTVVLASTFAAGVTSLGGPLDSPQYETETLGSETTDTMAGNPLSGSPGDLVRISDTVVGATDVRYRVNFLIEPDSDTIGNSLNSVYMEVTTGSPDMFSSTAQSDLEKVAIDEGSDGSVDREITHDVNGWQVQNGGSTLKIQFSGSAYSPIANDTIIVVFDGATNPDTADTYDLQAQTSGDGNWHYGKITITERTNSVSVGGEDSLMTSLYEQNRYLLTHAPRRSPSPLQDQFGVPVEAAVRRPSPGAPGPRR